MNKSIFAYRFGLTTAIVMLSLFISTAAFAGTGNNTAAAGSGPQQVVVTNTAAQPVPMVGLVSIQNTGAQPVPVTMNMQPFQTAFVSYSANTTAFGGPPTIKTLASVPANKRLVVEYISGNCSGLTGWVAMVSYGNGSFSGAEYLPPTYNNSLISMPVHFYVNPGEDFAILNNNISPSAVSCSITASGYWVNLQ